MLFSGADNPKIAHSPGELDPIYYMFLGPMRISTPNGIWISSVVFIGLTHLLNTQTHRPRYV